MHRIRHALQAAFPLAVLVAGFCLSPQAAHAQTGTSFTLQGTVFDPTGAVVPGATVSVKNLSLGLARTAQADDQGHYIFAALPPTGEYQISVESPGFASQTRRGLTFQANASAVINFTLKPGAVQENVVVNEQAPLVESTRSEVSHTVGEQAVRDLPLVSTYPAGQDEVVRGRLTRAAPRL